MMRNIFVLILIFLGQFGLLHSAEIHISSRMVGGQVDPSSNNIPLQAEAISSIVDFDVMGVPRVFLDKENYGYVLLGIDEKHLMDYAGSDFLDITVKVSITSFNANGDEIGTEPQELQINGNLSSTGSATINSDIFRMYNINYFDVKVDEIIVNNQIFTGVLPNFVYLESGFYAERYYEMVSSPPNLNVSIIDYEGNPSQMEISNNGGLTNSVTDELEFSWGYIPGAEYYELEWTWVDNFSTSSSMKKSPGEINFTDRDFELNNTKIRTSKQFYRIPQIFSEGYLLFRVRAVGRWTDSQSNIEKERFTSWSGKINEVSYDEDDKRVFNWNYITITQEHEYYKNWQYQATYAEDGKKKEVVQYFDGSLRNRQTVTRINSTDQSVVGETIYDNEGRGVVQMLPVPLESPAIKFYSDLNINDAEEPYSHLDFDWESKNVTNCSSVLSNNVSPTSGSGLYYSSEFHEDDTDWQKHVPDAQGYPYSQVEYTPDNTGRIKAQSGVGIDHALGSGKATTYFYGQPSQMELDRLFGYKVGNNIRYQKNLVVDANGQVSVSYLDAQGRVIATALAGDRPGSLSGIGTGNGNLTNDLIGHIPVTSLYDTPNDKNIISSSSRFGSNNDVFTVTTPIIVTSESQINYTFEYDAEAGVYTESCDGETDEYPVWFNVKLSLKNECSEELLDDVDFEPVKGETGSEDLPYSKTIGLTKGTYLLVKEISIDEQKLLEYKQDYLEKLENCNSSEISQVNEFIVEPITGPCAPTTCTDCISNLGDYDNFKNLHPIVEGVLTDNQRKEMYTQEYNDCKMLCVGLTETCSVLEGMLASDLRPYGQYGGTSEGYFITDPLSVYNSSNPNNWNSIDINIEYGEEIEVYYDGTSYTPEIRPNLLGYTPTPNSSFMVNANILTTESFIKNFRDSWAIDMLELHPEYYLLEYKREQCALKSTVPTSGGGSIALSSTDFDQLLKSFQIPNDDSQFQSTVFDGNSVYIPYADFPEANEVISGATIPSDNTPTLIRVIQSGHNLQENDPYFKTSYEHHEFHNEIINLRNSMMTRAHNVEYKNSGRTIISLAAYIVLNSDNIPENIDSWDAIGALIGLSSSADYLQKKKEIWDQYKNLYLSYKGQIDQIIMDLYGCYDDPELTDDVNPRKFNGSIGEGTFSSGLFANYDAITNMTSQSVNAVSIFNELCNVADISIWTNLNASTSSYNLFPVGLSEAPYDSKEIRMIRQDALYDVNLSDEDATDKLVTEAGYSIWKETGLCPEANKFQTVLNQMAQQNQFIPSGTSFSHSIQSISTFTNELYMKFSDGEIAQNGAQMNIVGNATSTELTLHFVQYPELTEKTIVFPTLVSQSSLPSLEWTTYGSVWKVISFSNIYINEDDQLNYSAKILVTIEMLNEPGVYHEYVMEFTTPFSFNSCKEVYENNNSISGDCNNEELFETALMNLINYVLATPSENTTFTSDQYVDLSDLPFYKNTILYDYFGSSAYLGYTSYGVGGNETNYTLKILQSTERHQTDNYFQSSDFALEINTQIPQNAININHIDIKNVFTGDYVQDNLDVNNVEFNWNTNGGPETQLAEYTIYKQGFPSDDKLDFNCRDCCYDLEDNKDVSNRMKNLLNYLLGVLPSDNSALPSLEYHAPFAVNQIAPFTSIDEGNMVIKNARYDAENFKLSFDLFELNRDLISFEFDFTDNGQFSPTTGIISSITEFKINQNSSYSMNVSFSDGTSNVYDNNSTLPLELNPCKVYETVFYTKKDLLQAIKYYTNYEYILGNHVNLHNSPPSQYSVFLEDLREQYKVSKPIVMDFVQSSIQSGYNADRFQPNRIGFDIAQNYYPINLVAYRILYSASTNTPTFYSLDYSLTLTDNIYSIGTSTGDMHNFGKIIDIHFTDANEDAFVCTSVYYDETLGEIGSDGNPIGGYNYDEPNVYYGNLGGVFNPTIPLGNDNSCIACLPEPQPPVSCDDAYDKYANYFDNTLIPGSNLSTLESDDYQLSLKDFCTSQYAYITDVYVDYLTNLNITSVLDENYLNLAQFGATELGYSEEKLSVALNAYELYRVGNNDPVSWSSYVNTIYMIQHPEICPGTIPPISFPTVNDETPCNQIEVNSGLANAQNQKTILLNEAGNLFVENYIQTGMSSLEETFSEKHADNEYHYTLYNYDRSGNLIQTVPPKGVKRMDYDQGGLPSSTVNPSYSTNDIRNARMDFDLSEEGSASTPAPEHELKTIYRYNSLNQLVYQETPDGGISRFAYDDLGRLVVSQNAKQLNKNTDGTISYPNQFSYTLYDYLGRVVEVGEFNNSEDISINAIGRLVNNSTGENYDVNSLNWVNSNRREVTRTIYDELKTGTNTAITIPNSNDSEVTVQSTFGTDYETFNTRNRIVGVVYQSVYNDDISQYDNATFYNYDIHGNVMNLLQVNNDLKLVTAGQNVKRFDYEYDLVSGNVNKVVYQKNEKDQFIHRYSYDSDNRITIVETSSNGIHYEKDAKYFYYDHGPLARVEIGESKVQAEDYAYTIQGWLKAVNGEELSSEDLMGQDGISTTTPNLNKNVAKDAFGYSLNYFEKDYISANTDMLTYSSSSSADHGASLYNGNIRSMYTALSKSDLTIATSVLPTHQTVYNYDQLNRIISMQGTYPSLNNTSSDYSSTYSYDANGNLKTLSRNSELEIENTPNIMDNLTYHYYNKDGTISPSSESSSTNKLAYVSEGPDVGSFSTDLDGQTEYPSWSDLASNIEKSNYRYDQIGQLVSDYSENIGEIKWTVTNKVKEINYINGRSEDKITFDYDAMGHRIAKHVQTSTGVESTYYVLDAQGNPMSTYKVDVPTGELYAEYQLQDRNIYGSKRLGTEEVNNKISYCSTRPLSELSSLELTQLNLLKSTLPQDNNAPGTHRDINYTGDKRYELSNHLGNVLNVISDRKLAVDIPLIAGTTQGDGIVDHYTAQVITHSDYYPFGMIMEGRSDMGGDYRYGFQGQEKDDEVKGEGNSVNYEYRMHDPRVGRFFAVDPLTSKYPHNGPYNFSENRVIDGLELEGLEVVTKSSTGTASFGVSSFNETGMILDYSGTEIKVYSYKSTGFGAETNISLGVDWVTGFYPDATANDLKGGGKVNVLSGGEMGTLTTAEAITANGKRGKIIGGGIGISVLPVSGAIYDTETTIKEEQFNPSEWTNVLPKINYVIKSLYISIDEIQEATIHHAKIGIEKNKVEWNRLYELSKTVDPSSSEGLSITSKMKMLDLSIEDHKNKIESGRAAIGVVKDQIKALNKVKDKIKDKK